MKPETTLTLHLLPTEGASEIFIQNNKLIYFPSKCLHSKGLDIEGQMILPQFVYLCSEIRITYNDKWMMLNGEEIVSTETLMGNTDEAKKIEFTNNPTLIKDGVKPLPEFAWIEEKDSLGGYGERKDFLPELVKMYNQKQSSDVKGVDVEKLATDFATNDGICEDFETERRSFIGGFKANQALQSKAGFSLEDMYMLSAFVTDFIAGRKGDFITTTPKMVADKFIQSLTPTQPQPSMYLIDNKIYFK